MASIKIDSDLRPIGSELFLDAESYLDELSADQEINKIVGGTLPTTYIRTATFTIPVLQPSVISIIAI
jgi:hypothetical protein